MGPFLLLSGSVIFHSDLNNIFSSFKAAGILIFFLYLAYLGCRLLWRILSRTEVTRKGLACNRRYKALLLIMVLPTILGFLTKTYFIPAANSERVISVDIWNGKFSVPRKDLKNWVSIEQGTYKAQGQRVPRLTLLYRSLNEPIEITVFTHSPSMNKEGLYKKREKYLDEQLSIIAYPTKETLYDKPEKIDGWEVYQSKPISKNIAPDLYVWKDDRGNISHILECTSINICSRKIGERWEQKNCKNSTECMNCPRFCADRSYGVSDYTMQFSFDKNMLSNYAQLNKDITNWVSSFYTPYN